ncbi:MAG: hypothetical protein ACR2LQ_07465 [Acidimicrobiales bacterium]
MSTTLRTSSRRVFALMGFAAVTMAALFVPARADAATAAGTVVNPPAAYSAGATGDLTDLTVIPITPTGIGAIDLLIGQLVTALGLPATSVANLHLVHANADADSTGINGGPERSAARAANLDPLTATSIDLSSVLSEVSQTAPPDNASPNLASLLAIPASATGGLLSAGVSQASVLAHWSGDNACVSASQPLSDSVIETADAAVLPNAQGGVAFVGPGDGAVNVHSTTSLPTTTAFTGVDPRAVQADSTTQTAAVNLFNDALRIDVITPPAVTANATGIPGTATASFTQPVLAINGNQIISGQDLSNLITPLLTALNPVLLPLAPLLTLSVSVGDGTTSVSPDGTSASATAALLTLHLGLLGSPVVDLVVLPLTATATAPAGGLDCGPGNPVKLAKTASRGEIIPGESFNYTINFTNSATDCTLTNTSLTDVITGPAGSEITGSDPSATSTNGLTITWGPSVVGDIGPGQSKSFTVTVKSPTTATPGQTYSDTATGSGDCNGTHFSTPVTLDGIPQIVAGLLARTGGEALFPTLGIGALGLALLGFRRLRRA